MLAEPRCRERACVHFRGVLQGADGELSERVVCAAYPDRIPDDVAYGADLHLARRDDQDNDIVYQEAVKAAEPRVIVASLTAGRAGTPLSDVVQSGVAAGLAGVVADIEREVGQ